jgi:hypothetical protein
MAAVAQVRIDIDCTGLGQSYNAKSVFNSSTTPTAWTYNYRTLATADTAEALDLGDVTTVTGVWIKAVSSGLYVDTSFVSTFVNEIIIPTGEVAYFKPAGTVYIKNYTAAATPTYEFIIIGTT